MVQPHSSWITLLPLREDGNFAYVFTNYHNLSNNPSNALFSTNFDMLFSLLEVSTCLLNMTNQILIFGGYLKVRESL